jgi:hypothetical protein
VTRPEGLAGPVMLCHHGRCPSRTADEHVPIAPCEQPRRSLRRPRRVRRPAAPAEWKPRARAPTRRSAFHQRRGRTPSVTTAPRDAGNEQNADCCTGDATRCGSRRAAGNMPVPIEAHSRSCLQRVATARAGAALLSLRPRSCFDDAAWPRSRCRDVPSWRLIAPKAHASTRSSSRRPTQRKRPRWCCSDRPTPPTQCCG